MLKRRCGKRREDTPENKHTSHVTPSFPFLLLLLLLLLMAWWLCTPRWNPNVKQKLFWRGFVVFFSPTGTPVCMQTLFFPGNWKRNWRRFFVPSSPLRDSHKFSLLPGLREVGVLFLARQARRSWNAVFVSATKPRQTRLNMGTVSKILTFFRTYMDT